MLTARKARELWEYNDRTGVLTWRHRKEVTKYDKSWNTRWSGKEAGTLHSGGYLAVRYGERVYYVHRIAWLVVTGKWPDDQIDHVNGTKVDNRWPNLRAATHAQNQRNRGVRRTNSSGVTGVCWHKQSQKRLARIGYTHLGSFASKKGAIAARRKAAKVVHQQFAHH